MRGAPYLSLELLEQVTDTLQKVTHGPTPMVRGSITNNKEMIKINLECWRRACIWNKVLGYSVAVFTLRQVYLLYVPRYVDKK